MPNSLSFPCFISSSVSRNLHKTHHFALRQKLKLRTWISRHTAIHWTSLCRNKHCRASAIEQLPRIQATMVSKRPGEDILSGKEAMRKKLKLNVGCRKATSSAEQLSSSSSVTEQPPARIPHNPVPASEDSETATSQEPVLPDPTIDRFKTITGTMSAVLRETQRGATVLDEMWDTVQR